MKRCVTLFAFAVVVLSAPLANAREGFGFSKRAIQLDRRVPPEVLLVASRVDVRVTDDGGLAVAARQLRDLVEEKMLAYDTRLTKDADGPEIIVELDVDEARADESWKQKTEYESRQTGTKVEYDSKGKKKEKPVYTLVPVEVNYKDVAGSVEAKVRLVDARNASEIWKGNASASFSRSFKNGDGAPIPTELEKRLVGEVAEEISAKLVGKREPVSVLVPRGSFDRLVPVAERGDWETYAREVEAMPAKKRPADEAFRQYALGVATEALAYADSDEEQTIERLRRAADHYRQAVALHPREELFARAYSNVWSGGEAASPIARVESALANYEKLREFRLQLAQAAAQPPVKAVAAEPAKAAAAGAAKGKASKPLRNGDVIEMAKAGLGDENIILAIDEASATEFDLSPQGLIAMSKGGVSRAVIAHMQKKNR